MGDSVAIRRVEQGNEGRAYTLLRSMYPSLAEADYEARLRRMQASDGYELHGLYEGQALIGVVGFIRLTNLIYDDYVWVHDLVIDEEHRGRGLGTRMMEYIHELAAGEGRGYVALAAHVSDGAAQRFYEQHLEYERRGVFFRRALPAGEPRS